MTSGLFPTMKIRSTLKGRNLLLGSKFFLIKLTDSKKGSNLEMAELYVLQVYPLTYTYTILI